MLATSRLARLEASVSSSSTRQTTASHWHCCRARPCASRWGMLWPATKTHWTRGILRVLQAGASASPYLNRGCRFHPPRYGFPTVCRDLASDTWAAYRRLRSTSASRPISVQSSYSSTASYLVCTGTNDLTTLVIHAPAPFPPGAVSNLAQGREVTLKEW